MSDHDLWQQAISFAMRAHAGQLRKDGLTPYGAHPARVAMTVLHVFACDDPVVIAAAALHDVIEDTTTDYDDLSVRFGPDVAQVVALVSKDARLPEELRERVYFEQIAAGRWEAQLVKLADVFDNISDASDPGVVSRQIKVGRAAIHAAGDHAALREPRRLVGELIAKRSGEDG